MSAHGQRHTSGCLARVTEIPVRFISNLGACLPHAAGGRRAQRRRHGPERQAPIRRCTGALQAPEDATLQHMQGAPEGSWRFVHLDSGVI